VEQAGNLGAVAVDLGDTGRRLGGVEQRRGDRGVAFPERGQPIAEVGVAALRRGHQLQQGVGNAAAGREHGRHAGAGIFLEDRRHARHALGVGNARAAELVHTPP